MSNHSNWSDEQLRARLSSLPGLIEEAQRDAAALEERAGKAEKAMEQEKGRRPVSDSDDERYYAYLGLLQKQTAADNRISELIEEKFEIEGTLQFRSELRAEN